MDSPFERNLRNRLLEAESPVSDNSFGLIQKKLYARRQKKGVKKWSILLLLFVFLGGIAFLYLDRPTKHQELVSLPAKAQIIKAQSKANLTTTTQNKDAKKIKSKNVANLIQDLKRNHTSAKKETQEFGRPKLIAPVMIPKKSFFVTENRASQFQTESFLHPFKLPHIAKKSFYLNSKENHPLLSIQNATISKINRFQLELRFQPFINYFQIYPERSDETHIYQMKANDRAQDNLGWEIRMSGFWKWNNRFSTALNLHYNRVNAEFQLLQLIPNRGVTAIVQLPSSDEQSFFPGYEVKTQSIQETLQYWGLGFAIRYELFPQMNHYVQLESALFRASSLESDYFAKRTLKFAISYGWEIPIHRRLNLSINPEFGWYMGRQVNTILLKTNQIQMGVGIGIQFR